MQFSAVNLQTGSEFTQLASNCSDCKIVGKSGQKSRSVFQALEHLSNHPEHLKHLKTSQNTIATTQTEHLAAEEHLNTIART